MISISEIGSVAPDSATLQRMKTDRQFTFDVLDWWTWQVRIRSTGMILPSDPNLRRVSAAIYRLADSLGMAPSRSDFFRKIPISLDKRKSTPPKGVLLTTEEIRLASADAWAEYEEARWVLEELREMLPKAGPKALGDSIETSLNATATTKSAPRGTYKRLAESLLRCREFGPCPGMRILAKRFGVSQSTVHKAMHSKPELIAWLGDAKKASDITVDPRCMGKNTADPRDEQQALSELLYGYSDEQRVEVIEALEKMPEEDRKRVLGFDVVDDWDDVVKEFNDCESVRERR